MDALCSMDSRNDFRSILPFLPLIQRSSAVFWPPTVVEVLKCLSRGPSHSNVNSGQRLALAIADIRNSLGFSSLHPSASLGFSVFFDDLMSRNDTDKWFEEVVPRLVDLLLRLPALLETHYLNGDAFNGMETGLRLLESQQPGIVFLSQNPRKEMLGIEELEGYHVRVTMMWLGKVQIIDSYYMICSVTELECLIYSTPIPTPLAEDGLSKTLSSSLLQSVVQDKEQIATAKDYTLCLYECYDVNQEHKIKCLVHYFEKVCSDMPVGNVSFERKVLPLKNSQSFLVYPEPDFWSKSTVSLCPLEVRTSGMIEDQATEALEVDFANKYIGGGALGRGCVQEEIRFMINPELIISMLFLSSMADNEAIEIVGAERFSNYTGYAKSFRFSGPHLDQKSVDTMGRRKTRIIAIDALCAPGNRQYRPGFVLREINKAFCGFFNHQNGIENSISTDKEIEGEIGVATGNWGCGAFGGDPEVKAVIQWVAASQALRPFILYYTFNLEALRKLELVVKWIVSQGWSVGDVWNILVEYSTQRLNGETRVGFFSWLLPSLQDDDPMLLDVPQVT